jgi:hypothetical protein
VSYSLRYAGYVSAAGPPNPSEWVGPPGPPGPPGAAYGSEKVSQELSLAATVGASASALLATLPTMTAAQVVEILSTVIAGVDPNYDLEIWADNPSAGTLVYQATGITAMSYQDTAGFYISAPPGAQLWVRVENVDPVATSVHVDVRYIPTAEN